MEVEKLILRKKVSSNRMTLKLLPEFNRLKKLLTKSEISAISKSTKIFRAKFKLG